MSYYTRKVYRLDKQVLYNNVNTNNLNGAILSPDKIVQIGQYRRIFEGTVWTNKNEPLKRAKLISPYTTGDTTLVVNYPYPFAVGDVLYEIGDETENLIAEAQVVNNATAQVLGTITAIDPTANYQVTEVTPSAIAINDVFTLRIGSQFFSFTATTTDVADVTAGLYQALSSRTHSHHSVIEFLEFSEDGIKLTFTAKEPTEIFTITGSVVGAGSLDIAVTRSVGALTITPDAGNNSHAIGAKVGTIDQLPIGIIAHSHILNDPDGLPTTADFAAYDQGNINKLALPYLDGQVVQANPTLKYFPMYGR